MRNLKVVFLFTPGPIGGAEKVIIHGLEALKNEIQDIELWVLKDHKVFEVTHQFLKLVEQVGVNYRVFSSESLVDLKLMRDLNEHLKDHAPDILHTHGVKAALYGKISAPAETKIVATYQSITGDSFKSRLLEKVEKIVVRKADAVIAVSDQMKKTLTLSHIPENKLFVVENLLTAKVQQMASFFDQQRPRFMFAGKLTSDKNLKSLIEAMKDIHADLLMIGEGDERLVLETHSQALGLHKKVKFLGFKKDVSGYLKESDALILSCPRSDIPASYVEATCTGIPVIHLENMSALEIEKRLNRFIEVMKLEKMEAEKKKITFMNRFSPEKWAQNMLSIYVTLVSE